MSESFLDLLTDLPHWGFEVASDIVLGLVLYLPVKTLWNRWHTRHDQELHDVEGPIEYSGRIVSGDFLRLAQEDFKRAVEDVRNRG